MCGHPLTYRQEYSHLLKCCMQQIQLSTHINTRYNKFCSNLHSCSKIYEPDFLLLRICVVTTNKLKSPTTTAAATLCMCVSQKSQDIQTY